MCACSSLGDNLPAPVGLPQNTPARPALQPEYLPVHDMPPARDTKTLTDPERKKIEADLVEVRDRQERGAGKPPSKQRAEKQPPEKSAAEGRPSLRGDVRVAPAS